MMKSWGRREGHNLFDSFFYFLPRLVEVYRLDLYIVVGIFVPV